MSEIVIRKASVSDAKKLLKIYRPYVEYTPISFELEAPDLAEFQRRIETALNAWSWLVAQLESEVVGYAYGTSHRPRRAYRFSVETSAYVHADHCRRGIARALYVRLFDELRTRGFGSAYAGITVPNEASIGFHQALGFKPIGIFPKVGWKFDRWHDVAWFYREI